VPAVIVSPWVDEGIVINEEYRHSSLLVTLRKVWDLGDPFTDRDAAARSFEHVLSREFPRDSATWPEMHPKPLPDWQLTKVAYSEAISTLGKAIGSGFIEHARQSGRPIPVELTDPDHPPTPKQLVEFVRSMAATYFPGLVPSEAQGA
jgi:phospholipase C